MFKVSYKVVPYSFYTGSYLFEFAEPRSTILFTQEEVDNWLERSKHFALDPIVEKI